MHAVMQSVPETSVRAPARSLAGTPAGTYRRTMLVMARRPAYGVSQAIAGVVAQSWQARGFLHLPLYGLDAAATQTLLEDHFPGISDHLKLSWTELATPSQFADAIELQDLVDMLVAHLTVDDADGRALAHTVATACLGEDHLWQDMNMSTRQDLSDMFYGFFTSLAVRNRQDMKWKKFLYKQLCDRAEIKVCKAPSCGVCTDYKNCFGSEV